MIDKKNPVGPYPGSTRDLNTPEYPRISYYVFHWATNAPDQDALVLNGSRIRYDELADLVDSCAKCLVSMGVKPGDRVAMLSTPRPEFFIVFLATTRVGAIWVGLNPKHTEEELLYVLNDAKPVLLIAPKQIGERHYEKELNATAEKEESIRKIIFLELGSRYVRESLSPLLTTSVDETTYINICDGIKEQDPALLVYTSGTTGRPKGALLPHKGLVYCSRVQRTHLQASPLRMINNLPVDHVGCVGDVSAFTLVSGGTILFCERFDADGMSQLIHDEAITLWAQVPTMFQLTVDSPQFDPSLLKSIQEIAWSGAMAPLELVERLYAICPKLSSFYGMTETIGSVCYTDNNASIEDLARTIGRPDPHFEVRIANPDGTEVNTGEAGEIQVRGDFIMKEYLNRVEATKETFTQDGWLKTGDSALEEPDGQYRLIGRLREMYKSGGYNVYPREIEIELESHPNITAAIVVPTPDPLYNEVGTAFIVRDDESNTDETHLQEHCRKRLANYKIPKHFYFLSDLPRLPIGKVDRAELKRRAKQLANDQ